ncbi:MAG: 50S ribosomal protein L4 [Bacillota bacterium]|jgi:large subunit ribosomal protein L4
MANIKVYNMQGEEAGEMELNPSVFEAKINVPLMHQAVVLNRASERRGTHESKTRGQVSGSTKKPWRQKGTGRARVGTKRNPVWTGGGAAFGPHMREYGFKMPRKMRRAALRSALSDKFAQGELIVFDELAMEAPKTKVMADLLKKFEAENALVVLGEFNENVMKSVRNLAGAKPVEAAGINVYNVLASRKLIMTKDAVAKVEEVLAL